MQFDERDTSVIGFTGAVKAARNGLAHAIIEIDASDPAGNGMTGLVEADAGKLLLNSLNF
jgi:hypothetical protein